MFEGVWKSSHGCKRKGRKTRFPAEGRPGVESTQRHDTFTRFLLHSFYTTLYSIMHSVEVGEMGFKVLYL